MPQVSALAPKPLLRAQKLAHFSDSAFALPFTSIRIGWEAIIGLIPGVGDVLGLALSAYIILLAKQMALPKGLLLLMLRNSLLDFALGLLPIVGDYVDIFYKANKANVKIMQSYWLEQHRGDLKQSAKHRLAQWERQQN
jgi:hypothetical protein